MIKIHRERATSDFLGIKNENWMYASRDLGAHALRLYLYLAANANGYNLALSPAAIRQSIGMPTSTYRDQFVKLIDKGYLVPNSSNGYDFFELPQARPVSLPMKESAAHGHVFDDSTTDVFPSTQDVPKETVEDREINNKEDSINNWINNIPQRIVTIPPPVATGKKRPETIEKPPVGEFIF